MVIYFEYWLAEMDWLTFDADEYRSFYTAYFKDFNAPLAWHHFSGDAGSGVAFKALMFLPSKL
jgi:HSP90 family molecular chaperone